MHKDELLQLHSLLCQVKRYFAESGIEEADTFEDYDELDVSPQHIHKSKTDHKRAVFMLGKGLSDLVMVDNPEHRLRLKERFAKLAGEAIEEPEVITPAPVNEPPRTEHLPAFALAALSG